MKHISLMLLSLLAVVIAIASTSTDKATRESNSFKVIELFTSEGCSSCPPAEQLIRKIAQESAGKDVFILTYHVDYWDKLGWEDPFSNAAYSAKQYEYGTHFNLSSVYTPQIVVNGSTEFVGSDEHRLRKELGSQTTVDPISRIAINDVTIEKNTVKVQFSAIHANTDDAVRISLVQKAATSSVNNGENRGRTLVHVQIVRDQKSIVGNASLKSVTLTCPQGFNPDNFEIIGFIQTKGIGKIIAATRKSIQE